MQPNWNHFLLVACIVLMAFPSLTNGQDAELALEKRVQSIAQQLTKSVLRLERIGAEHKIDGIPFAPTSGTALVVDKDGWLLTSACFVADRPTAILITMPDGQRLPAKRVASDLSRNLALLKIESNQQLVVPKFIPRKQLNVGQTVVALGRTFATPIPQVSVGILSAKDRIWGKAIQTDAKTSLLNYGGPLVTLDGSVAGLLTPLSTRAQGPLAGLDWYDSGIGFAVPIDEVNEKLDVLKQGTDLLPGILGVNFKSADVYADPVVVAFCLGSTPAAQAGLKIGDQIIQCNGKPVERLAQLKHVIGAMHAGDQVSLKVSRSLNSQADEQAPKSEEVEVVFKLIESMPRFQPVGIGLSVIAASASEAEKGLPKAELEIRHVEPDGPADKVGIKVGDRLTSFGEVSNPKSLSQLRMEIATIPAGAKLECQILRAGQTQDVAMDVAPRSTSIPAPHGVPQQNVDVPNVIDVALPEDPNQCYAIVPAKVDERKPGLLVWLPASGQHDRKRSIERWQNAARENHMTVLVLTSAQDEKWDRQEIDTVLRAINSYRRTESIDPNRVSVGGDGNGGTLASLVAFQKPNVFAGLVLEDALPSKRLSDLSTSPIKPQMMLLIGSKQPQADDRLKPIIESLIPLEQVDQASAAEILRWADSVDRL